jgi:tRNA-splicing ligase RtcB
MYNQTIMSTPERKLEKITDWLWEIPKVGDMRVPGRIYASEALIAHVREDQTFDQVANVACLPGILGYSMAMPDIHWGYGFPIGGVAAFDLDTGVISPGGVGYDINCGVRLMRTNLTREEMEPKLQNAINGLFKHVPSGVGSKGQLKLKKRELQKALVGGARWAVEEGYGDKEDLEFIEESGRMPDADPEAISDRAYERGGPQLGTLGSGNHFVEIGYVSEVFDAETAQAFGLFENQITVTVHTGSRGFGHQVCDDYIKAFKRSRYSREIPLPDPQLCCAPIRSEEGKRYYGAMCAGVNFAFANRQMIGHWTRESLMRTLGISPRELGIRVVYEVAHNIAKIEEHQVDGAKQMVCIHRKGATRAFAPGHPDVPKVYREVGQPVLIPGDMGRYSYVLAGTREAMENTFGSTCHGAGRMLSRHAAIKRAKGKSVWDELKKYDVVVKSAGMRTIVEEMPEAYKDVSDVVEAVANAGISKLVVQIRPMGCIKG